MTTEGLHHEINALLQIMATSQSEIVQAHERVQVALSSSLRLLDGKSSTLAALKGDPESIKGYLLTLLVQLRQTIDEKFNQLNIHTRQILKSIEE